MDIIWYGHSCFRLTERGSATVVTDPFDHQVIGYEPLKLTAGVVTFSHDAPGHNYQSVVKGKYYLITGPGEYEIGGVFITGVQTNNKKKRDSEEPRNILYVFDYDGVTVAHLGDLRHVPSQTEIEALGNVHVALVPVGGGGGLIPSRAVEVVSLLEPGIVIPMHYGTAASKVNLAPVEKFLKEMGVASVETLSSLKVSRSSLQGQTRVVLLDHKQK